MFLDQYLNLIGDGLILGVLALGLHVAFRWGRFPDLTPDGSFVVGAVTYLLAAEQGVPLLLALALAGCSGAAVGIITSFLAEKIKLPPVVAGLLVATASYSIVWRCLGRPNVFLSREMTLWGAGSGAAHAWTYLLSAVTIAGLVLALLAAVQRTVIGIRVKAICENRLLAADVSFSTMLATSVALAIANGLVALAGALSSQRAFSVDINMGVGVTVTGLAAMILGSASGARLAGTTVLAAVLFGGVAYKALIFVALRTGLPAEMFRLYTSLILISAFWLLRRRGRQNILSGLRWT